MPHYNSFPVKSQVVEPLLVSGRFTADPAKTTVANPCPRVAGKDYIAWRVGTGVYRIRVDRPGARVVSCSYSIKLLTPAAKFAGTVVGTAESGKAIEVMVVNASGAAVDLTSSDEIWFNIMTQVSRLPIV